MKRIARSVENVGPKSPVKSSAKLKVQTGRPLVRLAGAGTIGKIGAAVEAEALAKPRARKRGEDVRERVLRAALECFGAFGFEGTSTRAVASRAKVTHTLVLYHFQSKEQLWIATMQEALDAYAAAVNENLERRHEHTARAALSTFIEQFVRMSAETPQIHRILTMESNQGTERLDWIIEHFIRGHFTLVRDLIRRGQAEGSVREFDPARLYYQIIGMGGTPFTISTEYKAMTGRDVFSEAEILRIIAFIHEIVFK